jgi:hypothetical protein
VALQRRHLADCWVELLESGLIARQADPPVPVVADRRYTLRVRGRSSGAISEVSSERSDVLGRWLMALLGEGRMRQADLELVSWNRTGRSAAPPHRALSRTAAPGAQPHRRTGRSAAPPHRALSRTGPAWPDLCLGDVARASPST